VQLAERNSMDLKIVRSAIEVNEEQKQRMVARIESAVGELKGKTIGILGLAFKPNTDDMRDAPSLVIIEGLQKKGAGVKVFDPESMEGAKKMLKNVEYCENAYDAAQGSDALIFITEWNQFRMLDMEKIKALLRSPVVVDLRNIYDPQYMRKLGFIYSCIGRG